VRRLQALKLKKTNNQDGIATVTEPISNTLTGHFHLIPHMLEAFMVA